MMGRLMGGGAGFAQQPLFKLEKPGQPCIRQIYRCGR
ncbi:lipoprotein [Salmonella enterica subsp. enterica]|uniref:Lipoprotein n=1 Tax=Salmonella enterica I TaxID=59201 RepID=A0A3S5DMG0_SALET|nr:lipoprotein [Salmonella enterica subsp. enterica]